MRTSTSKQFLLYIPRMKKYVSKSKSHKCEHIPYLVYYIFSLYGQIFGILPNSIGLAGTAPIVAYLNIHALNN